MAGWATAAVWSHGSFFLINVVFLNYQINLLLRSSTRAVMRLREVSQCLEKESNRAFSLLILVHKIWTLACKEQKRWTVFRILHSPGTVKFREVPLTSLSRTNVADVAHTDKTQNHHCAVINGFLTFNDGLYILPHHMWTVLLHTLQNLTRPQTKC